MANSIPKSVAPTSKTFTRCLNGCVAVLVILATLFVVQHASAQEFRGTISGTVTDPSGAVVKGARVTITEVSTGSVNTTQSDNAGQYVVPFLQPGDYQI